jgi:hypothetical protein
MYRIIGAKIGSDTAHSANSTDSPAGRRQANVARVCGYRAYGYWPGGSRDFLADQDLGWPFHDPGDFSAILTEKSPRS